MKHPLKEKDWVNIVFFCITPLIAVVGTSWLLLTQGIPAATWILAAVFLLGSGLSITAGYHRLFAHRSYDASFPVRLLYLFFGSAAWQGSVLWWSAEHRVHHRLEDTEQDPYGIDKGFWYAHIGWLLEKHNDASNDNIRDLLQDPWLVWQQRLYGPVATITSFVVPMAIASLWGDPWGGLIVAGVARMVVLHHSTFCINSVCHFLGKKTYSRELTARDSWISALITYGEGYHNFHHTFQYDYRNGIRGYQWDPTKWLIGGLSRVGLATNLRRANREHIMAARIETDMERLTKRLGAYSETAQHSVAEMIHATKLRLEEAHSHFVALKKEYRTLRKSTMDSMSYQVAELRAELRQARREFKAAWSDWLTLVNGPLTAVA